MHFLICCATPWELKAVKNQIKKLNLKVSLNISYLCTWIGENETIYTLTQYLTLQKEEIFIINIGICGYWNDDSSTPPNFIQIGRIKNSITDKEFLPPIPFEFGKLESIYSSLIPLVSIQPPLPEKGFVDMESRAIEFVSDKFRIPRILLKVPYDRVGEETKKFNKEEACKLLEESIDYKDLITKALAYATKI